MVWEFVGLRTLNDSNLFKPLLKHTPNFRTHRAGRAYKLPLQILPRERSLFRFELPQNIKQIFHFRLVCYQLVYLIQHYNLRIYIIRQVPLPRLGDEGHRVRCANQDIWQGPRRIIEHISHRNIKNLFLRVLSLLFLLCFVRGQELHDWRLELQRRSNPIEPDTVSGV